MRHISHVNLFPSPNSFLFLMVNLMDLQNHLSYGFRLQRTLACLFELFVFFFLDHLFDCGEIG